MDLHRTPGVLALTVLLTGGVSILVSSVEAGETRTGQRPSAGSTILRLPKADTADRGAEKITRREIPSQPDTVWPLPHIAAARGKPGDRASQTASFKGPAQTTEPENAQNLADPESPVRRSRPGRVTQVAADQYHRAMGLAGKGALYAAEELLVQTLWLIARSRDEVEGSQVHGEALAAAIRAWREAEDLAPALGPNTTDAQVARLIAAHSTPLPKNTSQGSAAAVDVLQVYYAFSQEQLLQAVGHEPVASRVLYGIGRLQTAPSRIPTPEQRLAGAKAIALFRSALDVDDRNYAAANELGVLLARCGQLEEAKAAFLQSASVKPSIETWQNVAAVGERLGDVELARQAHHQYQAVRERQAHGEASLVSGSLPEIRWVNLATFAGAPSVSAAGTIDPQPPVAPAVTQSAEPKSNGNETGFKGLFDWLPGMKTKSPSPQPPPSPRTALRNGSSQFAR